MDTLINNITFGRLESFPLWVKPELLPLVVGRCRALLGSRGARRFVGAYEALEAGDMRAFVRHYEYDSHVLYYIIDNQRVDLFTSLLEILEIPELRRENMLMLLLRKFSDVWRGVLSRALEVLPSNLSHVLVAFYKLPQLGAEVLPWLLSRPRLLITALVRDNLPLDDERVRMLVANGLDLADPAVLRWAMLAARDGERYLEPRPIMYELVALSHDPFQVGPEGFSAYELSCALLMNWHYFPDHDRETLEALRDPYPTVYDLLLKGHRMRRSVDMRGLRAIAPAVFELMPFAWGWHSVQRIPILLGNDPAELAPASWRVRPGANCDKFDVDLPVTRFLAEKDPCSSST